MACKVGIKAGVSVGYRGWDTFGDESVGMKAGRSIGFECGCAVMRVLPLHRWSRSHNFPQGTREAVMPYFYYVIEGDVRKWQLK